MKMIVGRKLSSAGGWFPPRSRFRNKSTNWVQPTDRQCRIKMGRKTTQKTQLGQLYDILLTVFWRAPS